VSPIQEALVTDSSQPEERQTITTPFKLWTYSIFLLRLLSANLAPNLAGPVVSESGNPETSLETIRYGAPTSAEPAAGVKHHDDKLQVSAETMLAENATWSRNPAKTSLLDFHSWR